MSRLKACETQSKKSYGFIDYAESIAARRAFASKIFVKGKHVKVSYSCFMSFRFPIDFHVVF